MIRFFNPEWTGLLHMSFCLAVTIALILKILDEFHDISSSDVILTMFIPVLIGFFLFVWRKRYLKIILRFEKESKRKNLILNILLICYYVIGLHLIIFI